MAVSVNVYRSRIGQFNSSRIGFRKQIKKQSKSKRKSPSNIFRIVWVIAIILATSTCNSSISTFSTTTQITPKSNYKLQFPLSTATQSLLILPTASHAEAQLSNHKFYYPIQPPTLVNNNFLARYKFGNRGKKKNGITIVHWNKGSSLLKNKKDDIETIIEKYKPHVLGLSEANLRKDDDISDVQLSDYNLHTCPTIHNPEHGVSRVVVYTHKSLIVKPRPDLMNPWISAVWLEVGLPRRHKFLVCNAYREWGYPNQTDRSSHSINAQKDRWSLFLDKCG